MSLAELSLSWLSYRLEYSSMDVGSSPTLCPTRNNTNNNTVRVIMCNYRIMKLENPQYVQGKKVEEVYYKKGQYIPIEKYTGRIMWGEDLYDMWGEYPQTTGRIIHNKNKPPQLATLEHKIKRLQAELKDEDEVKKHLVVVEAKARLDKDATMSVIEDLEVKIDELEDHLGEQVNHLQRLNVMLMQNASSQACAEQRRVELQNKIGELQLMASKYYPF